MKTTVPFSSLTLLKDRIKSKYNLSKNYAKFNYHKITSKLVSKLHIYSNTKDRFNKSMHTSHENEPKESSLLSQENLSQKNDSYEIVDISTIDNSILETKKSNIHNNLPEGSKIITIIINQGNIVKKIYKTPEGKLIQITNI